MNTEEPLIYTAKGNLPVSSLRYVPEWQLFTDRVLIWTSLTDLDKPLPPFDEIVFVETYYLGDELVKRSAAPFTSRRAKAQADTGKLGG